MNVHVRRLYKTYTSLAVYMSLLVIGLQAGVFSYSAVAQDAPVHLQRISFVERSDSNGYVVRMHTDQAPEAFGQERLSDSELLLTLYQSGLEEGFRSETPQGPISDYSTTTDGDRVKIRFEFSADQSIQAETYRDSNSSDLLLNLSHASDEGSSIRLVDNSDRADAEAEQPYVLSKEARDKWKLDCVVIDPGHGGHDTGSQAHGVREKDIVLNVARKLGTYIEDYLDLRVVYTRKSDRFVPLHERGRIANENCGKLFVSIHANALPGAKGPRVHGTETYILGLHKTNQARQVMERENSVIELENNPDRYEGFDEEELVVQSLAQNMYMRESEILAEKIETQFDERAKRHSRGIKQAGFLVLWRASMPAVLVELGFVTNPTEAAYLSSDQGQTYLASAIFRAVRAYKAEYEKGLDLAAEEE